MATVIRFDPDHGEVPLETEVRKAVAEMRWVEPSDQAAFELACRYARWIEMAAALNMGRAAEQIGPRLEAVLVELGATPMARLKITGGARPVSGRLAELRQARKGA